MVKHSPPGSAVFQAMYGEAASWTVSDHLLACAVDSLRLLAWMQSADGAKNRNRPTLIERPGTQQRAWTEDVQVDEAGHIQMRPGTSTTIGAKAQMTPEEFAAWWNSN